MATKNAINSDFPVEVASGGTGAATLTNHGVLVGSGTGAVSPLSVGATGTLLVGTTAADPTFSVSSDGNFSFTSATAAVDRTLTVENTDDTDTGSIATLQLSTGGSSAGDARIVHTITGQQSFTTGIDNTDDFYKIAAGTALGTTDIVIITADGEITKPLQSAFLAYLGTIDSDVTGDNTAFTLGTGNALTEVYDQNADFNTNGTFTAPVTGRYIFSFASKMSDLTSSHTQGLLQLVTSNGSYSPFLADFAAIKDSADELGINGSIQVDMDASDTAVLRISVFNGTKVVDIEADDRDTFFSGHLMC